MENAVPIIFLASLVLGLLPASIAKSKGRSFFLWYIYGALLFLVAVIHAIVLKPNENAHGMRKCPSCASVISKDASICPACRTHFNGPVVRVDSVFAKPIVQEQLYSGERSINSSAYQLFLTKRYAIEKNNTLEKYTIDESVFDTLQDALKEADLRYAAKLAAVQEQNELTRRQSALENERALAEKRKIIEKEAKEHALFLENEAKQIPIRAARQKKINASILLIGVSVVASIALFKYIDYKNTQATIDLFSKGMILDFEFGVSKLNDVENKIGHNDVKSSLRGYLVKYSKNDLVRFKTLGEVVDKLNGVTFYYCVPDGVKIDIADNSTYKKFVLTGFSVDYGDFDKNSKMLDVLLSRKIPDKWNVPSDLKQLLDVNEDGLRLLRIDRSYNKREDNIDICGNGW